MRYWVRACIACSFLVWYVHPACAYVPEFVVQPSLHDITTIAQPDLSQVYFGELTGMPHTFEIDARDTFTLSLELRTPETASSTNSISGIVIKVPQKGRVEEVARLFGKSALWEEESDSLTGDTYRKGASFFKELGPGLYRIEIHTPDNAEKYMLHIGTLEEMTLSYFELISRLLAIKDFYGTSRLLIVCSSWVYVPLFIIVIGVWVLWYIRRRWIPPRKTPHS